MRNEEIYGLTNHAVTLEDGVEDEESDGSEAGKGVARKDYRQEFR